MFPCKGLRFVPPRRLLSAEALVTCTPLYSSRMAPTSLGSSFLGVLLAPSPRGPPRPLSRVPSLVVRARLTAPGPGVVSGAAGRGSRGSCAWARAGLSLPFQQPCRWLLLLFRPFSGSISMKPLCFLSPMGSPSLLSLCSGSHSLVMLQRIQTWLDLEDRDGAMKEM